VKATVTVYTITPVKRLDRGKARLAEVLNLDLRIELSLSMLQDVLKAIASARSISEGVVVSSDEDVLGLAADTGFTTLKEESQRGVNEAVEVATRYCLSRDASSTLVLPADIPLVTSRDINGIVEASNPAPSVVITPSLRMDGTNAFLYLI